MLLEGDILLLCSDGLTRMVTDPEIASTLLTVEPAQAAADRLVELANDYGGEDNVTVIVVRFEASPSGLLARMRRWTGFSGEQPTRNLLREATNGTTPAQIRFEVTQGSSLGGPAGYHRASAG